MSFLSFSLYFRNTIKNHKYIFFYVSPSLCFTVLLFSFFIFFSFHSFKHWRTFNIHVNIQCNLLSPPVLVDSTRFSLYGYNESIEEAKAHTLTLDFKTYTFRARFSPDQCPLWRIRPSLWRASPLEERGPSGVWDILGSAVPLSHLRADILLEEKGR